MRTLRAISFIWFFVLAASAPSAGQTADTPYGFAKFAPYADIGEIKQLKMVWDFNFTDPAAVGTVFNFVSALLSATSEFGPHEIDPIKVVIVSHGPELVVFARKNYARYKETADRAASLTKQGVKFEICLKAATSLGFAPEDFHGFATLVPAAPYSLAYWQAKGYSLNAVGATMPITPLYSLNKGDINRN